MAKKIMIVDDEPQIISTIKIRLEAEGYEVVSAADGDGLVQKAAAEKPDLILLDILMPGVNGIDARNQLKESAVTRDIPVIFLTALKTHQQQYAQQCGSRDMIIGKPFDARDLLSAVNRVLMQQKQ